MKLAHQMLWRECESRLAAIKGSKVQGKVLQEIDAVSEKLCTVLDELNSIAHLDPVAETREEARRDFLALSEHVQAINTDSEIYRKLKEEDDDNDKQMSLEGKRVASRLLMEFEWEGAALPSKAARDNVGVLQNKLRQAEYQAEVEYHQLAANRPKILIPLNPQQQPLQVENSEPIFQSVMFHETDAKLRKLVYDAHFAPDDALEKFAATRQYLREARHEVANALGFSTHAHFAMNKNMANDPAQVELFLRKLAGEIKPIVRAKLGYEEMFEWEYQRHRPATQLQQPSSFLQNENKLNAFFTMERTLQGIAALCEHLFNVKLVHDETAGNEFKVYNEGEFVGIIVLDLHHRENKSPHPCLFPLRTSCGTNAYTPARAVISCGFSNQLGHVGFRILMHEFGHALHTVLSKTEFQHLSGTRGEIDFIETPSSLLERMAWSKDIISFMDRDKYFCAGELDMLDWKRVDFAAVDLHEQVFYALFDLHFHLHTTVPENKVYWDLKREFGPFKLPTNTERVRREVFFQHVLGYAYAGSVYSYVWGAALTCDLWDKLFAGDPLNRASGTKLKRELFENGGAMHPNQVMQALVGRSEIDQTALLKDISL